MDHRRVQSPDRSFGQAPTAAWQAWRVISPCRQDPNERELMETWRMNLPYSFMKGNPASNFLGADAAEPSAVRVRYRTDRALKKARQRRRALTRQVSQPIGNRRGLVTKSP
jgi:hypothetical protein